MIAKLSGILDSVSQGSLILDVGGVGYLVHASGRTLAQAGRPGDTLSLRIETIIREDAFNLYGFQDKAEQEWFRLLTSVQGVGARVALAILNVAAPEGLGLAIAAGDKTALTRAEGVGPKLATRILTELKDKAGGATFSVPVGVSDSAAPSTGAPVVQGIRQEGNADDQDAVSALVNLGYGRSDAYQAVARARAENDNNDDKADLQSLIRQALQMLSGG
ncbi:MAG: Holliday junction branch migration protein RuvA [Alphaproteobacteria bacterium]|nr:Holliday junction branch migration protein RuvA [Alphaproteobacteria bacterium]